MAYSRDAQALISILQDRPIAYHPKLAAVLGSIPAAIWLGQLMYWDGKSTRHDDGWIEKTSEQFKEETFLTTKQQELIRTKCIGLGVVIAERRGIPAKPCYKIDYTRLSEVIVGYDEHAGDMDDFESTVTSKGRNLIRPSDGGLVTSFGRAHSLTESTSESVSTFAAARALDSQTSCIEEPTANEELFPVEQTPLNDERGTPHAGSYPVATLCASDKHIANRGRRMPKPPAPLMDHPAVMKYREICRLTPNQEQRVAIADANLDVAKWDVTLRDWMAHGWRPQNIPGMIERYRNPVQQGFGKSFVQADQTMHAAGESYYTPDGTFHEATR